MTLIPWRLLRSGPATGSFNMALDQALLEAVAAGRSGSVLRLYHWFPATVSLGYAQRGRRVVNLASCRDLGLDVVRRFSGGRAVLHDQEMTYAVIAPEPSPWFPAGVAGSYRIIGEALQAALDGLGLETTLAIGRHAGAGSADAQASACFTAPATAELVHAGCKVTGSAQKRQKGGFLQHGSVPVDLDPVLLFRALDTAGQLSPQAGGALLARRVGWLNRWLPVPRSVEEVETAFIAAFSHRLGVVLEPSTLRPDELARARSLERLHYANPAWNLAGIAG
ncbi:lipoate--protein ligase family protein [Desulfuromonas sp. DDH964]|uniref:lipoate--protein ligase family protein n=1 Tax=Desulfuromonas sp. DDH964 TaxID=1823759 RepID=UPI00078BDDB5|nr:biotin/lipoate A/B protein ligase family protein [Desulfuromonas sp. DDH964]AMV71830.1 lipoate--protein ligase A [Desulfuromonas sp. DDH964]